jgi:hypothetical protein
MPSPGEYYFDQLFKSKYIHVTSTRKTVDAE